MYKDRAVNARGDRIGFPSSLAFIALVRQFYVGKQEMSCLPTQKPPSRGIIFSM